MAADAEDLQTRASEEAQDVSLVTPFMAKSAISDKNKLFPVAHWAPRAGFNMEHQRFTISLRRLGKAFGLPADWIQQEPPPTPHLLELRAMPLKTRQGETGAAKRVLAQEEVRVLDAWRAVNTAIYFHVEPAIEVEGTFFLRDTEEIDAFVTTDGVADGRGLVRWALKKVDTTSKVQQRALNRTLGQRKLDAGATRVQFSAHYDRLYQHWALLHDSDPDDRESLAEFYDQLLDTMPTTPATSHIVSLRTWLAGQISTFRAGHNPDFVGRYEALDALSAYAKTLGVPLGTVAAGAAGVPALLIISPDGELVFPDDACGACDGEGDALFSINGKTPSQKRTGRSAGGKPPGQEKRSVNKCKFCDAFGCQSDDHGGPERCISRFDSSFDISKLPDGQSRHVRLTRAWHKENKHVTTLKGVVLKLKKAQSQQAGGAGAVQSRNGTMAPIVSSGDLIGPDGHSTDPEFDAWLKEQDGGDMGLSCIYVITSDADGGDVDRTAVVPSSAADGDDVGNMRALLRQQQAELEAMRLERQELAASVTARRRASFGDSSTGSLVLSPSPTLPRGVNPALTPIDRSVLTEVSVGGDQEPPSRERSTPPTRRDKDTVDHLTQAIVTQNKEVKKYRAAAAKPLSVQVLDKLGVAVLAITTKACEFSWWQWLTSLAMARWLGPHAVVVTLKVIEVMGQYGRAQLKQLLTHVGQAIMHRINDKLIAHTSSRSHAIASLSPAVLSARERALHMVRGVALGVAAQAEQLGAVAAPSNDETMPDSTSSEVVAQTQGHEVLSETGSLMMLGNAGGKRSASQAELMDDLDKEAQTKYTIGVLRTVVEALHAGTTDRVSGLPRMHDDLNHLARVILGIDRTMRETGLNSMRVTLAHHVWPDVYPTLIGACAKHGVSYRTAKEHSSALSNVIRKCFDTQEAWRQFVSSCEGSRIGSTSLATAADRADAAEALTGLASELSELRASVGVVVMVSTTGDSQAPVKLDLVISTMADGGARGTLMMIDDYGSVDTPVTDSVHATDAPVTDNVHAIDEQSAYSHESTNQVDMLGCAPDGVTDMLMELGIDLAEEPASVQGERDPFDVCGVCLELGLHCTCTGWIRPPDYNSADELERFMYGSDGNNSPVNVIHDGMLMPLGLLWGGTGCILDSANCAIVQSAARGPDWDLDQLDETPSVAALGARTVHYSLSRHDPCLVVSTGVSTAGLPAAVAEHQSEADYIAAVSVQLDSEAGLNSWATVGPEALVQYSQRPDPHHRSLAELRRLLMWRLACFAHVRRTRKARALELRRRVENGWASPSVNSPFRNFTHFTRRDRRKAGHARFVASHLIFRRVADYLFKRRQAAACSQCSPQQEAAQAARASYLSLHTAMSVNMHIAITQNPRMRECAQVIWHAVARSYYRRFRTTLVRAQRQSLHALACARGSLVQAVRVWMDCEFDAQRAHGEDHWRAWRAAQRWPSLRCMHDIRDGTELGTLMALDEAGALTFPPGTLGSSDGCVPALSDNGASYKTGCARTTDGAVLDTFSKADAGRLTVGDGDSALVSQGSYIYVHERYGSDGSGEVTVRRLKHTPNLPVAIVYSEPTEVYLHRCSYTFDAERGRIMVTAAGQVLPLFMSSQKLGFLKVRPVVDAAVIARARAAASAQQAHSLMVLGDGALRTVGMPKVMLRGVELLRREHVSGGHVSLRQLLRVLKAKGLLDRVTKDEIQDFAKAGCGSCESAKMKRRAFTLQTVADHTRAPVGKKWIIDELQLKVVSAGHAYTYVFVAVDDGSGKRIIFGMRGMSADDQIKAREQLRAAVRPDHGEIWVVRADSLPGHRARKVEDYSAAVSIKDELSPPYVHEGVHKAENTMMHGVPAANALLMAAPDLGAAHFFSAFRTALVALDHAPNGDEPEPTSNIMRYHKRKEWVVNPLLVYGSACKALIHPEVRDDKYQHHAFAAVYTGPAFNSQSPVHCSVWDDGYTDVDAGCVNIDERVVLARTHRTHPSHQPFNQVGVAVPEIVPDTNVWYDPSTEVHPAEQARKVREGAAAAIDGALPRYGGELWTPVSPIPAKRYIVVIGSGAAHDGDFASWVHGVSLHDTACVRIDPKVGGYAHRIDRDDVLAGLKSLVAADACIGLFLQLPCGAWCSSKFRDDGGPKPIFTADARDGIMVNGRVHVAAVAALALMQRGLALAEVALCAGKLFMSEHPVSHGRGSLLHSHKLDQHSNMHQTTAFAKLIARYGLVPVYTDQGASGHEHRKSTELLCDPKLYRACMPVLGVLRLPDAWVSAAPPLSGKNPDGSFVTKAAEVYPPLFAERLARVWLTASTVAVAHVEGGEHNINTPVTDSVHATDAPVTDSVHATDESYDGMFARGDRIEVYWTKDKCWYAGKVVGVTTQKHKKLGMQIEAPAIQVLYDDGQTKTHSMHNNDMRHEDSDPLPTLLMIRSERSFEAAETELQKEANATELENDVLLSLVDIDIEIETGLVLNKSSLFVVSKQGELELGERVTSMDTLNARYWHCPGNERDYDRSPQKGLWRTAKELKWDQYLALNMFDWVPISSIDRKLHRIYSTLWAYAIKLNADLTFKKLNPRWCLKGGTMDRDKFKAHAETLRIATFRVLLALKAGYWEAFCEFLLDCSDAFQTTRTDGADAEEHAPLYCYPAAGFERVDAKGERLVCKVNVGMQGRIDATRLFNARLFGLLLVKAGITRSLWDRQLMIYHNSEKLGTSASLTEILTCVRDAKDTAPQQAPIGYAIIGWHVDDGTGLACAVGWNLNLQTNRVLQYLKGSIEVIYATTLTGWHGKKALGFALTLRDKTVNMSAPDSVAQLAKDLLKDTVNVSPKHAMTKEFVGIEQGVVPTVGDPTRDTVLARMALTRHALGVFIWLSLVYIEIARGTNELCSNMAFPSDMTLKCCRHQSMYLSAHARGITWGPCEFGSLERPEGAKVSDPLRGPKLQFFHFFSDANLDTGSITGGVGMLAGGAIIIVSQRQHLANPNSHAAEITAASSNYNVIIPTAGVLQELHVLCGSRVPLYLDSSSSVFVAKSDTAVKKSIWLIRRAAVLEDGVVHGEIEPLHISERDMVADPFTKYLIYAVWARHMHYALNYDGPLPPHPNEK